MPIDFSKITPPQTSKRILDPIELFQSLAVSDPAINDLWLAQGDALRQWHETRSRSDVAIVLNTGAGKTLVGLLAAQSLVNETGGRVLYACSSIQLVEQTTIKARGYGLSTTTYVRGAFNNSLFELGLAPCVTTYQALFNGRSRLARERIDAVVFDDAHTAEHLLRDQFTLRIDRSKQKGAFEQITQTFRAFFAEIGHDVGYRETMEQRDQNQLWFVPPFAVRSQLGEIKRILVELNPGKDPDTMFAWEYVKDHLDLCGVFITGHDVSLTPPVVPVGTLAYFVDGVRRLYLSATLAAQDSFLRTFGRIPDPIISPGTTAGECERLIIVPSMNANCKVDVDAAKRIAAGHKALILVPTHRQARKWSQIITADQGDDVSAQIEEFKGAKAPATLALVARYDGVDLPGDTCRVMVIDELPSGAGPLERFLWEYMGLQKSLRSTVASRVVQSFGRISRGMSDYGVVVITGRGLVSWLLNAANREMLPDFLRRQLELGLAVSRQAESQTDLIESVDQCLDRQPGWIAFYQNEMGKTAPSRDPAAVDMKALEIARAEVDFGRALWERDYAAAAKCLEARLDETFKTSIPTAAWHSLWLGYAHDLMGDAKTAHFYYQRAHGAVRRIPPHARPSIVTGAQPIPSQVVEVAEYLDSGPQVGNTILNRFDRDVAGLTGVGTVAQAEEAVRALGEYLGLDSSRPDQEYGTGPDVLWQLAGTAALCLDLKTELSAEHYSKQYVGNMHDHMQWVRENSTCLPIHPAFVGPVVPATQRSNPPPETVVIELQEFAAVAERLRGALDDIRRTAHPSTLVDVTWAMLRDRGLIWPDLFAGMKKVPLRRGA